MFRIDECADAALLLRFSDGVQGKRGFTGTFRPIDFHDTSLGQAANPQGNIERERAGRYGFDFDHLIVLAQTHD